jgi:SAM-dependent methyltransferase
MTYINSAWRSHVVYAAAELGLADLLAEGPQTSTALAECTATQPAALHRFLRAMASLDLCSECADGRFALRPLGTLLQRERRDSMQPWALTWGRVLAPPWTALVDCLRHGKPAPLGGDARNYASLAADPSRAALFNRAMATLTEHLLPALLAAYRLPAGSVIVDVGGGTGQLLAAYLRADPAASGVLLDLAPAIAAAGATLSAAGVAERCRCVVGDFFQAVPAGADVYLLKSVLHDWSDAQALEILRRCATAVPPSGQLLIIERLAPTTLTANPLHQATAAADLNLLVGFGGRVRQEKEFAALLDAVGLHLQDCRQAGWSFAILIARAGAS